MSYQEPRLPVFNPRPRVIKDRPLSPRQMQALLGSCRGLCNKEIAEEMGTTRTAVAELHRTVYEKLNVTCRVEAVTHAIKQGWYSPS